jgi:hypothetical protein
MQSGGGVWQAVNSLVRAEGARGLYRGFAVGLVGGVPASCIYFTTFEASNAWLQQRRDRGHLWLPAPACHLAAGLAAEAASCAVFVPVDVLKQRLQVARVHSVRQEALAAVRSAGGLHGLYRGYWATLASFGPFSAIYFALYEKLKQVARDHHHHHHRRGAGGMQPDNRHQADTPLPLAQQLLVAGAAGAAASALTSPLDLVKLRLQA